MSSAKVMANLDGLIYNELFDTATLWGSPRDLTPSAATLRASRVYSSAISVIPGPAAPNVLYRFDTDAALFID